VGGITYLTQLRVLQGPPGIAWHISVAIPTMDLLKEARWRALASLYLGLVALGFVAWRVRHLARRFSDPLVKLAESSEALAHGEAVTPPPSDILEIQQVGEAFHAASRTLKERNELEARVQHIQRLETLGTLAGGIAHDINNQLQAISGKVALGLMTAPPEGAFRKHLEQAEEATLRCAEITLSLLSFSRPSRPEPVSLDLNAVIRQAAGLLEHMRGNRVKVVLDLASDLPPVLGQAVQLEQVFINLGVNAKDAMPEGGTLTFATSVNPAGGVSVRVADTGTGMSAEVLARMSDPFFTTKGEGKGTGLGMAIVTGILAAHEASFTVDSEPGRGTTFMLSFPDLRGSKA
jgi:signal transduction histidine kinase